jgi:starvation-inducible DNA-binding protein
MSKGTIKQLKQIQADAHAMFVKVHNYHWNVKGMDFMPVHLQTETIYNSFATLYDDTAERVLQLEGMPHVTLSDLVKTTNIKEEKRTSFNSKEVIKCIVDDYKYFKKSFKTLKKLADKENDDTTVAFCDDNIAQIEKDLWMLGNMVGSK